MAYRIQNIFLLSENTVLLKFYGNYNQTDLGSLNWSYGSCKTLRTILFFFTKYIPFIALKSPLVAWSAKTSLIPILTHVKKYIKKTIKDRPWWPSGLERVSNSSRHSLEDPGLNPTRGMYLYGTIMDPLFIHCWRNMVSIARDRTGTKVMTRTEPLNEDGSPPHREAQGGARDGG